MDKGKLNIYPVPAGIAVRNDFKIYVRLDGVEDWQEVVCYEVKVDMHDVRKASMTYFDFEGKVNVKIRYNNYMDIYQVDIRPKSKNITPQFTEREIYFDLEEPGNFSIEINKNRFHNLHLFAGKVLENIPDMQDENIIFLNGYLDKPVIHNTDEIRDKVLRIPKGRILYFGQGIHYMEECVLKIPSDTNVYMEGGAVVVGSFICDRVENIKIFGRGIVYQTGFERFCAMRGIRISHSRDIWVEGITFVNPPHYTVYVGGAEKVIIRDIKAFSCEGWSDGIDIMSSRDITISHVFMRNSDDCIAIYGGRWDFHGDTRNILVEHSALWADVAHPMNIGCHGDCEKGGNLIENIVFTDIDILEHHEPQMQCMGCMCINAGDKNTVRNVRYENICVEQIEHGRLFDIRVICGRYNSAPGKLIENVYFKDIFYNGYGEETSEIGENYEGIRVKNIIFDNLVVRGKAVRSKGEGNINIGKDADNIVFT